MGEVMKKLTMFQAARKSYPYRIAFNHHVCWSCPKEIVRDLFLECKSFVERGLYGYSRKDIWDLHTYLDRILIPTITAQKNAHGWPGVWPDGTDMAIEDWYDMLDRMADSFRVHLLLADGYLPEVSGEDQGLMYEWAKEGRMLFATWFEHLWD